jgi:serine acetyltransferase
MSVLARRQDLSAVTIGDHARIRANAVILRDVKAFGWPSVIEVKANEPLSNQLMARNLELSRPE